MAILPPHLAAEGPVPSLEADGIREHMPDLANPVTSTYL